MSEKYRFQDDYLGVSDDRIHFLRNRFEYQSTLMSNFHEAEIKKGKSIKNWGLLLLLGSTLVLGGLFLAKNIYNFLLFGIGSIYVEEVIFPFFMLLIGGYFIYQSLRREWIIEFKGRKKSVRFSLETFREYDQMNPLIEFLEQRMKIRRKVEE